MNPFKDVMEQGFRNKDLCHLKRHIPGMAYDLGRTMEKLMSLALGYRTGHRWQIAAGG